MSIKDKVDEIKAKIISIEKEIGRECDVIDRAKSIISRRRDDIDALRHESALLLKKPKKPRKISDNQRAQREARKARYIAIKILIDEGKSKTYIAKAMGVSITTIRAIIRTESKLDGPSSPDPA